MVSLYESNICQLNHHVEGMQGHLGEALAATIRLNMTPDDDIVEDLLRLVSSLSDLTVKLPNPKETL